MKIIFNVILILLFVNHPSFSQNIPFENQITYKETVNIGDGDWDIFYDLYFNNTISLYHEKYGDKDREVTLLADGSTSIVELATEKTASYYYSYLHSSKMLFGEEIAYDYYHFEEEVPEIKWELFNETKKIGGFICKKATGKFRGRNYTAWYTEEIPVNAGPWKLKGLSGLILEVADDAGVYKAQAINISLGKETDLNKKVSKIIFQTKRRSIDQYAKKKHSEQIDILNYLNAKAGESGTKFSVENQNKREFIELF